ncbi:hypothetical protein [Suilimivivens sp.]|uniref:hypothetical protein n=1 Tax=Suilimivivens sp. TaxID=2981669 RepID=UPI003079A5DB
MWIEDFVILAPPGAEKKRKSGKSKSERGMEEKKGHGREKVAGMPRRKRERREKAGKVSPGGAWKRKRS